MGRIHALYWWIDRWRQSSAYCGMTLEEQGAYRNLLDEATLRGGDLPTDDHYLAKACGDPRVWSKVRAKVLKHFVLVGDTYQHDTLNRVNAESRRRADNQKAWRDRHADNGAITNPITEPITERSQAGHNVDSQDQDQDGTRTPLTPLAGGRRRRLPQHAQRRQLSEQELESQQRAVDQQLQAAIARQKAGR